MVRIDFVKQGSNTFSRPIVHVTPNARKCYGCTPSHQRVWFITDNPRLVEESNDLAGDVLAAGLLVVHDTSRSGQDNVAKLTGGQQLDDPLLHLGEADVVSGRDDTGLVEATIKLNNNLAGAVVVDLLELANVA